MQTTKGIMLPAVMLLSTLILLFVASTFSIMFNDNITTAIAVETEGAKIVAKSGYQAALSEIESKLSSSPFDPASVTSLKGESGKWMPCSSFQKSNAAEYCYAYSGNTIVAGGRVRGKNRKWVTRFVKTHYFLESRGIVTKELKYGRTLAEQNGDSGISTHGVLIPSSEMDTDGTTITSTISEGTLEGTSVSPGKEKGGVQDKFGAFINSVYAAKAPFPLEAWIGGASLPSSEITKRIKFSGEYNVVDPKTLISSLGEDITTFEGAAVFLKKLDLQDDSWGKGDKKKEHIWVLGSQDSRWDPAIELALFAISYLTNTGGAVVLNHPDYQAQYEAILSDLIENYKKEHDGNLPGAQDMNSFEKESKKKAMAFIYNKFYDELKEDIQKAVSKIKWGIEHDINNEELRRDVLDGYSLKSWELVLKHLSKEVKNLIGITDDSLKLNDIISHHDILMDSNPTIVGESKVDTNWGGKYLWVYPKNDTVFINGDLVLVNNAVLVTTGNIVVNGNIRGNGIVISLSNIFMMPINRSVNDLPQLEADDNLIVYAAENVYLNNNYNFGRSSFDPALFAALPQEVTVKFSEYARSSKEKDFYKLLWQYAKENPNEIPPSLMAIYFGRPPQQQYEELPAPSYYTAP